MKAATRANVAYLNERFEALNGNLAMALAAYNGGENRVMNLRRRYGDNFWDSRVYYSLPRETREYVPRILAAATQDTSHPVEPSPPGTDRSRA